MKRLYCPKCGEYLEGGDGECHDCSCGWKQEKEESEEVGLKLLYCPECGEYLEGGDGECHDCLCGWKQPGGEG